MIERWKYEWYVGRMLGALIAAAKAKKTGNERRTLALLEKSLRFGEQALRAENGKLDMELRALAKTMVCFAGTKYQSAVASQMPAKDRELLSYLLVLMLGMRLGAKRGEDPAIQMIRLCEIAKRRLDSGTGDVISLLYGNEHTPAPMREIMRPLLEGRATREETAERLGDCAETLRKWGPVMFPADTPLSLSLAFS